MTGEIPSLFSVDAARNGITFVCVGFLGLVVERSAQKSPNTRLVIAILDRTDYLLWAHNPKVGGSNPSPATKEP